MPFFNSKKIKVAHVIQMVISNKSCMKVEVEEMCFSRLFAIVLSSSKGFYFSSNGTA